MKAQINKIVCVSPEGNLQITDGQLVWIAGVASVKENRVGILVPPYEGPLVFFQDFYCKPINPLFVRNHCCDIIEPDLEQLHDYCRKEGIVFAYEKGVEK